MRVAVPGDDAHGILGGAPLAVLALLEILVDAAPEVEVLPLAEVEAEFRFLGLGPVSPAVEYLAGVGLARVAGDGVSLYPDRRCHAREWVAGHRWTHSLSLGPVVIPWRTLAAGFGSYLRARPGGEGGPGHSGAPAAALPAGGVRYSYQRSALTVVVRLAPAGLAYLTRTEDLMIITSVVGREQAVAEILLRCPAVYRRVGIYDLSAGVKMSVVSNPLFALFEWFLRDEYGWRPAPSPAFTRALVRTGLLAPDR